jgi:hypothetical protein
MRVILLNTAYNALRWYVSSGIFNRVAALIIRLITEDVPGEQKRERVIEFVRHEYGILWGGAQTIVIDAVIALVRLKATIVTADD